jgi:hypothetical protein
MTLVGQVFTFTVVGMAPIQPTIGPKSFVIGGALDLPLCENINETLGILLTLKTSTH